MIRRQDHVFFRCAACGGLSPMTADLAQFDAAEYVCEHCGEGTWVELDQTLNRDGERFISARPLTDADPIEPADYVD